MGNLWLLTIPADLARNKPHFALRQAALQMLGKGVKENQGQRSSFIGNLNPVGQPLVEGRWRLVAPHLHFDGNNALLGQVGNLRTKAPVDNPAWQMKQQIDNACGCRCVSAQELRQQLVKLLANALDARGACKQGVENRRTHGAILLGKVLQRKCRSG